MRFFTIVALAILMPAALFAQELVPDTVVTMKARVVDVVAHESRPIPGTASMCVTANPRDPKAGDP